MQKDPINTAPIENFIKQVKAADNSRSNDVKMDIDSAKNLAFTLGIVMSRLNCNLEEFVTKDNEPAGEGYIEVQMDGGKGW
tara:strand:- start:64 stop:306 length:243 start_codon:yes stop_codon:yes gene_type:complete